MTNEATGGRKVDQSIAVRLLLAMHSIGHLFWGQFLLINQIAIYANAKNFLTAETILLPDG